MDLQYLNLAVNNICTIEGLSKCESLRRLDLTLNFISPAALPSVTSLIPCYDLKELHLLGNPCTQWPGYRDFVIAHLPQLKSLDGEDIATEERENALQNISQLEGDLQRYINAVASSSGERDVVMSEGETCEIKQDEKTQERQPWCPATRVQDQREAERRAEAAAATEAAAAARLTLGQASTWRQHPMREYLPEIEDEDDTRQCNEGDWEFCLEEEREGDHAPGRCAQTRTAAAAGTPPSLVLRVRLEPHLDMRAVHVDVHPTVVRVLARGRLLQLRLPREVRSGEATAQRSIATGQLLVNMPIEYGTVVPLKKPRNIAHRPHHHGNACGVTHESRMSGSLLEVGAVRPQAAMVEGVDDDGEGLPALPHI